GDPVDQESDPTLSGTISPPACLAAAGRARNQPAGGDLGRAAAPPDGYGWPGAVNYVRQRRRAAHGEGSGAPKGDRRPHCPWRKVLVAGQFALSLLLLVAAGLFGVSLIHLLTKNPGFEAENLATFAVDPQLNGYTKGRSLTFFQDLERRLAALPGVTAVGAAA